MNFKYNYFGVSNKGFTLIELLVVIAIIGMLSSIVLGQLNNARNKGSNSAVKNNLANLRAQAELYYDNNSNSYNGVCSNTGFAKGLDASSQAGAGNTTSDVCNNTASAWAASAPLKTAEGTSNYWCVDSSGRSQGHASALTSGVTACP